MSHRSKERIKRTAEVFTPPELVEEILNKLPSKVWRKGKTFIDPACGNGNFLVAVLTRKLKRGHPPLEALQSIYGTDIMLDNIQECRMRLLATVKDHLPPRRRITDAMRLAVKRNIKWLDPETYPNGALDYNFSF